MSTIQESLGDYHAIRVALIGEDRFLRRDYTWAGSLTSAEMKADKIVREIRAAEATSTWNADYDSIPHPFPGMEFLTGNYSKKLGFKFLDSFLSGKSIIMKTRLFELLTKAILTNSASIPNFVLTLHG